MRKKLTESQLHNLIKNKVRKALRESCDCDECGTFNSELNEYTEDEDEKFKKMQQVYDMLCKCQDIVEDCGHLNLMYAIEELRHKVDSARFGF